MLVTTAEVKDFLRITAATYDVLISEYIPIVQEDICLYCNHWFQDEWLYREASGGIAFVRGSTASSSTETDTITDDDEEFSTGKAGFVTGMDIAIDGSGANSGIYTVGGVSSGTLTLTCRGILIDQDQDDAYRNVGKVKISRIRWPIGLKPIAAKMIWSQIDNAKPSDAKSERIDDYSVTYAGGHLYPTVLVEGLNRYKRVSAR